MEITLQINENLHRKRNLNIRKIMLYLVLLEVIGILTEKGYKTVSKNNTVDERHPERDLKIQEIML